MTYDEYKAAFDGIMSDTDTGIAKMPEVMETLKTDLERIDALEKASAEKDVKIRELQDTNMKLYLNIGGGETDTDTAEEVTGVDVIDEFMDTLFTE